MTAYFFRFQVLLVLPLLMAACSKSNDPAAGLPPATHSGANTGGCLIDGKRFVATGTSGTILSNPIPALGGGFYNDSVYRLGLRGATSRGTVRIGLFVRSQKAGTYLLNRKTSVRGGTEKSLDCGWLSFSGSNDVYITDARHTGRLVLTHPNKATGLSAGTFEFTGVSDLDSTKTITITNGRFDSQQ